MTVQNDNLRNKLKLTIPDREENPINMLNGAQLEADKIIYVVSKKEAQLWSQGGLSDDRVSSTQSHPSDNGLRILKYGTSVSHIHSYFTSLEQRKCCLLLTSCQQRFCNVRLLNTDGQDIGIEEGAMMNAGEVGKETVHCLDSVDFQVFQHALLCAAFPVLGAPNLPLDTPPISQTSCEIFAKRKNNFGTLRYTRAVTPLSHHDSGVEEQDDNAMVPLETLCELLRRAFRLSPEKFIQYEDIIASQMDNKLPDKILAEELVTQLITLENNNNQYYSPKTFLNRSSYDHWQQRERTHITELLGKFWYVSNPNPANRTSKASAMHLQYSHLLKKLIIYESPYRQQREHLASLPTSPLSSASLRLLKEFGLRYGVGEQYRKIVYLNYLTLNFDPTMWFVHHVISSLASVMESMPTKRSSLVIVKEEYSMLEDSIHLLEAKASVAIAKMKTLYSGNRPQLGVEPLIELLAVCMDAKAYLLMCPKEPIGTKLYSIVQTIFPTTYERHKMVSQDELRHNRYSPDISPKLLNMMIGHIREEVQDYKQHYQSIFESYFNITFEAAQEFYGLLMADVTELLQKNRDQTSPHEINKLMLSLAYRLNQLDQDWATYINPLMQIWREKFLVQAQHWCVVMKLDMQKLIVQAVSLDRYAICKLHWTDSLQSTNQGIVRQETLLKALFPSSNSAFSLLSSSQLMSTHSTVDSSTQNTSSINIGISNVPDTCQSMKIQQTFAGTCLTSGNLDTGDSLFEKRTTSDPVNISQNSMQSGSYLGDMARTLGYYNHSALSFTHIRHSSSLPSLHMFNKYQEIKPNSDCEEYYSLTLDECLAKSPSREFRIHSDDSDTLTDGTCSPEEGQNFSFPPLEEVVSTSPVYKSSTVPINTISKTAEQYIWRPVPEQTNKLNSHVDHENQISHPEPVKYMYEISSPTAGFEPVYPNTTVTASFQTDIQGQQELFSGNGLQNSTKNVNIHDTFTESLFSNISFPVPDYSHQPTLTNLPISSSAVDVIVVLQRLVGIGKVLCKTLTHTRLMNDTDQSSHQSSNEDELRALPSAAKTRQKLYENFLNAIRGTITAYADNMLCMDLCGCTQATACRLAGSSLVEYLQIQQQSGLIWGCRHDLMQNKNCFEYLNKKTFMLCDRHEAITRSMCARINNVFLMQTCLEWYHHCLGDSLDICGDLSVKKHGDQLHSNNSNVQKNEFVIVDNYAYDSSCDRSEVMETISQLCLGQKNGNEGKIQIISPVDSDNEHLMAVLRALCRIMAYRLNLFVLDALPVLLHVKGPNQPIDIVLKPVTDFLSNYIITLRGWLYKDCLRRVLECLWIFIAQDFERELIKIEEYEDSTENTGQLLLQALSHLLKFMNNQDNCLQKELLLAQADDVLFKLSLYTLPLRQLIALYHALDQDMADFTSTETMYQWCLMVRQRLKHDLLTYRKDFSGAELIRWMINNQEIFDFEPGPFTREKAHYNAQSLLNWGMIADVERHSESLKPDEIHYPDVTLHAQMSMPEEHTLASTTKIFVTEDHPSTSTSVISVLEENPSSTNDILMPQEQPSTSVTEVFVSEEHPSISTSDNSIFHNICAMPEIVQKTTLEINRMSSSNNSFSPALFEKSPMTHLHKCADLVSPCTLLAPSAHASGFDTMHTPATATNLNNHSKMYNWEYNSRFSGTPLSMVSFASDESALFYESEEKFYYICPYIGDEQRTCASDFELLQLVEECFQKKVTTEFIAKIISSKRNIDFSAKMFFKSADTNLIEKIKSQRNVAATCVSS